MEYRDEAVADRKIRHWTSESDVGLQVLLAGSRRAIVAASGDVAGLLMLIGSDEQSYQKSSEVLTTEIIRDVGRVLPWLASEPRTEPIPTGMSAEERTRLLAVCAQGLRDRYDSLYPVVDRAGRKLMAELEELNPAELADPEGEGAAALERAESHFSSERADLARLRDTLIEADASPAHDVFDALDRLDGLYAWIVATLQEIRWTVLIVEGTRLPPAGRMFTSGAALVAAFDD